MDMNSYCLKVVALSKSYFQHKALQDITFNIPKQSILGLLGPNGAGKTTLIRIITQIIAQDSGVVYFDGQEVIPADIRRIGYLPEERGLYKNMKVGEQLMFFAQLKGMQTNQAKQAISNWLEILNAGDWWNKSVDNLSKGMSQKVQFITAVIHNPRLIILDEPFSGFDPINADLIKQQIIALREAGATIIFSTHRMESVEEMCDKVIMLSKGRKIIDASSSELRRQFKTDIYDLTHEQPIETICTHNSFQLLKSVKQSDGLIQSKVKLNARHQPNDLLKAILPITQVHHFAEQIPSMNDIFIQKVQES